MKIREFFLFLKDTKFNYGKNDRSFGLYSFGRDSYGTGKFIDYGIIIDLDGKKESLLFSEMMDKYGDHNLISIDEIYLDSYESKAQSGNIYYGHPSKICLKISNEEKND